MEIHLPKKIYLWLRGDSRKHYKLCKAHTKYTKLKIVGSACSKPNKEKTRPPRTVHSTGRIACVATQKSVFHKGKLFIFSGFSEMLLKLFKNLSLETL